MGGEVDLQDLEEAGQAALDLVGVKVEVLVLEEEEVEVLDLEVVDQEVLDLVGVKVVEVLVLEEEEVGVQEEEEVVEEEGLVLEEEMLVEEVQKEQEHKQLIGRRSGWHLGGKVFLIWCRNKLTCRYQV